MLDYLEHKPKGKFGAHEYQVDADKVRRERARFQCYQKLYQVPNEA